MTQDSSKQNGVEILRKNVDVIYERPVCNINKGRREEEQKLVLQSSKLQSTNIFFFLYEQDLIPLRHHH